MSVRVAGATDVVHTLTAVGVSDAVRIDEALHAGVPRVVTMGGASGAGRIVATSAATARAAVRRLDVARDTAGLTLLVRIGTRALALKTAADVVGAAPCLVRRIAGAADVVHALTAGRIEAVRVEPALLAGPADAPRQLAGRVTGRPPGAARAFECVTVGGGGR